MNKMLLSVVKKTLVSILLLGIFLGACRLKATPDISDPSLVGWWKLDGNAKDELALNDGAIKGDVQFKKGIEGQAAYFNGKSYIEIPNDLRYSPAATGQLTVSFWMNPSRFDFKGEAEGYVHFLAKQEWSDKPNYEWAFRLYNDTAVDDGLRAKRVSFYLFNLQGGQGVGSYFQDDIKANEWIYITGVVNGTHTLIYKDGIIRDADAYSPGLGGYKEIIPGQGTCPVRIGTADMASFFEGGIDELKIWNRALSPKEILQNYNSELENKIQ
jgi:hypothetical protein